LLLQGVKPGSRHYDVEEGQVHEGECYDRFRERSAPKCAMCSAALLGSFYEVEDGTKKVCAEGDCHDKWRESKADKCDICAKPLLGSFYNVGEEGSGAEAKVCADGNCHDVWRERAAPKCAACGGGILGRFYDEGARGKVHAEGDCYARFQQMPR